MKAQDHPSRRWGLKAALALLWETREQFDRFAEEQIGPRSAEVGMSPPSNVAFHDVHNHLTPG